MKVLHVISGLDTGGAELFLERLALDLVKQGVAQMVVALRHAGGAAQRLQNAGIPVQVLHAGMSLQGFKALMALRTIVRQQKPDIIQGWMYHGNLGASLARRLGGATCPVMWNIRHSLDGWGSERMGLRALIRLGGHWSGSAVRIVFNSQRASHQHVRYGYPAEKAVIIPNGFDCERFTPDIKLRLATRRALDINDETPLVGMVARYSAVKDHGTFLRAARRLVADVPHVRFVLVGKNVDRQNFKLQVLLKKLQLDDNVTLLGERTDIPALLNAMDVCVSSSWAEGFPNAVGEAMACGVPCVVTDVGASAELIGDTGRVVPARAPEALAAALRTLIHSGSEARAKLGTAARERILRYYRQEEIVEQYVDLYRGFRKQNDQQ